MTLNTRRSSLTLLTAATVMLVIPAQGFSAQDAGPTGSLMARHNQDAMAAQRGERHGLRRMSMIAVAVPEQRTFRVHDLVQIIVRETSKVNSKQKLEAEKDYSISGRVNAWPDLRLSDIANLQMYAGRTNDLPRWDVSAGREFSGDGKYERADDFTARVSAQVIEILPNGNLVLEARTFIKTDQEEATIKVTGICRPNDVTSANTVLSSQIHDLRLVKEHKGELRSASEKGIIARVLDAIFAF